MVCATQVRVSAGQAVHMQWRPAAAVDGSTDISIPLSGDSLGSMERLQDCNECSWAISQRTRSDSNEITFDSPSRDGDGSQTNLNDTSFDEHLSALQKKIANDRDNPAKTLRENNELWKDPATFFEVSAVHSAEELSYRSLEAADKEQHLYQNPFHKVTLALFEEERFEVARGSSPHFLRAHCRSSLLKALNPGHGELDKRRRNTICRRFTRFLDEGLGLLLSIAPIVSASECVHSLLLERPRLTSSSLDFVSKKLRGRVLVSDLMGQEALTESEKHGTWASALLNFLVRPQRVSHGGSKSFTRR
jgi:hypothetical protein